MSGSGRIGLVLLLAVVLATAAACGGGGDSESGDATATTAAPATGADAGTDAPSTSSGERRTYRVGIDIPFHPLFDYVAAKKDDYFKDKPYDVEFQVLDATTQLPAFGNGDLDVITTVPSFIPRVNEQYGRQLAEFFPLARWTPGPELLVSADSPYTSIEDLKGKTVAIQPLQTRFGQEEAAVLAATGENIRDYFDLKETDAAAQELSLGRVDAAFLEAPATFELTKDGKFKAIFTVQEAFEEAFADPAVVNGGYLAEPSFIEENQAFVDDLIAATEDAWNRYQADPDAVNAVASEQSGIPPEQLRLVGEVLNLEKMPKGLQCISHRDVATWTEIFPLLAESGFIEEAPDDVGALFVVTCN